jgi:NAD(P)H-flavin reductase
VAVETAARPRLWRYYSPATLPDHTGSFELHVRAVGGGPVSTALVHGVHLGDVVRCGAPVGQHLTLDPSSSLDLLLIAGGTGLAPMKALIEQLAVDGGRRRVQLFWGGRRHADLYDLPAIERLAAQDWVRFIPCVSEEPPGASATRHGTAIEVALRYGVLADQDVYVCGPPAMVDATVDGLLEAGVPARRVRYEHFGYKEAVGDGA